MNNISGELSSPPTCTTAATKQLPAPLVQKVEATEASRHIVVPTGKVTSTILQTRSTPNGTAYAVAEFMPRYCGFQGTIAYHYISNRAALDPTWQRDEIVVIRSSQSLRSDLRGICISDTVPTARTVQGVIHLTIDCNRLYPSITWMQTNPQLQQLP